MVEENKVEQTEQPKAVAKKPAKAKAKPAKTPAAPKERGRRRVLQGTVTSDKMQKTITVLVETYISDKRYHKRVKYSKKFHAHDEKQEAKIGDKVQIIETRPLSATKRFRLLKVTQKAVIL